MTGQENRKNRKNFGSRLLAGVLLVAVILLSRGTAVLSADTQEVDLARTDGSVTLQLQYVDPDTSDIIKMSGGTVAVYKVSDFVLQGDGNYGFDVSTGQFPEAEGMENLTERLNAENSTIASRLSRLASSKKGIEARVSDGSVKVSNLQTGLFLMVQTKKSPENMVFDPFLFTMPYDGNFSISLEGEFDVTAKPKVLILEPEPTLPSESGNKGTTPDETPTVPSETAPPTTPNPGTPTGGSRIPQTGQLWWPVPILFLAGFFLTVGGIAIRIKA